MSLTALSARAVTAAPAVGTPIPGTNQLATVVGWTMFGVGIVLIVGFVVSLGSSGVGALRHGHYEGGMGAIICLVCGVFLAAAPAIFAVLGIHV